MQNNQAIARAVQSLGGPVAAARKLNAGRYQTVQQWIRNGRVPAKYCPLIEREMSGVITCEELRPDVDWAYLRGTEKTEQVTSPGAQAL